MVNLEIVTTPNGAELKSIIYQGREYLHQGENVLDEDGNVYWKRRAPILFPIVGALKNNTTKIGEKDFHMSQHGFARDMKFDIVKISEREHTYVLKYNEETLKMYPYKFELYVTYTIRNNSLTVAYRVNNVDNKEIYFAIGGHPAFSINLKENRYKVEFDDIEEDVRFLQLENGLVSYNNDYVNSSCMTDKKIINIKKDTFAHDAIIMSDLKSKRVRLIENDKELLEMDFSGFKYLALWSKKNAPFICIEPWYNTADYTDSNGMFLDKKDIIKLEVNKSFKCEYTITFK